MSPEEQADGKEIEKVQVVVSMPPGEYRATVEKSFKQVFEELCPGQVQVVVNINWYSLVHDLTLGHCPQEERPYHHTHLVVFYRDHNDEMGRRIQGLRSSVSGSGNEPFWKLRFIDPLEVSSYLYQHCRTLEGYPFMYAFGPSVMSNEGLQGFGILAQLCPSPGQRPEPTLAAASLVSVVKHIYAQMDMVRPRLQDLSGRGDVSSGDVPSFQATPPATLEVVVDPGDSRVTPEQLFLEKYFKGE